MNKLIPILGVIVVLALAGGGFYYYQSTQSSNSGVMMDQKKETSMNQESATMSLKELLMLGQSQQCTFAYSDDQSGSVSGTSYVSGEKVRTDFQGTQPNGEAYDGGMIIDGEYMYTWNSSMDQGVKMAMTGTTQEAIDEAAANPDATNESYNPSAEVEYDCKMWNEDLAMFTPPSNIEFMDFSEQLKMIEEFQATEAEGTNTNACDACASLSGEAAAMCKSSLGCE